MAKLSLTGIKPTGSPHIGNYLGGIRPAMACAQRCERAIYFVADYHALTVVRDPKKIRDLTIEVAATWLTFVRGQPNVLVFRDSDIPEILELNWILACVAAKGLLNRAHAYKAAVDANTAEGRHADDGVNMGLFNYPVLMAADILAFAANEIPVGRDQQQHVEIARDLAISFNQLYGADLLQVPEAVVMEEVDVVGLDGRKMSKNYGNTIPLFGSAADTAKMVRKIITDAKGVNEPKDAEASSVYKLYRAFAQPAQVADMKQLLETGAIGWGKAKDMLAEALNGYLAADREYYQGLMADPRQITDRLQRDAEAAREMARPILRRVKEAMGVVGLGR